MSNRFALLQGDSEERRHRKKKKCREDKKEQKKKDVAAKALPAPFELGAARLDHLGHAIVLYGPRPTRAGLVQQAIDSIAHKTTIVVVAHRLSTVRKADLICVMEKGRMGP